MYRDTDRGRLYGEQSGRRGAGDDSNRTDSRGDAREILSGKVCRLADRAERFGGDGAELAEWRERARGETPHFRKCFLSLLAELLYGVRGLADAGDKVGGVCFELDV